MSTSHESSLSGSNDFVLYLCDVIYFYFRLKITAHSKNIYRPILLNMYRVFLSFLVMAQSRQHLVYKVANCFVATVETYPLGHFL
jgi:hypothetical protein